MTLKIVEILETPEGVVLRTVEHRPSMVKKGHFWVHTGELPPGYDILKAIDEDREERISKAWSSVLPWQDKGVMVKATVSSKGHIAIPKQVRERLNLKAGTQVSIDVQGEALVMKRVASGYPDWRTMRGMAKGGESLTKALMEERAAEMAHYNARINQGR